MLTVHKITKSSIQLKCSPDHIDDLIWLLDMLTSAARRIRRAARAQAAQIAAECPEEKAKRQARYEAISAEAYRRYEKAKKAGQTHSEAMQTVKRELNCGYEDTRIYIAQGRRQYKEQLQKAQLRLICPD